MGTRRVDINTAGVDELATLLGVGRARAEAIVEKREVSFPKGIYSFVICLKCWGIMLLLWRRI